MLRSTWLSAATFTTVGYGDMRPRTAMGRMFTIFIAVIGTIYTSMPITLVGGKFRSLYARYAEKPSADGTRTNYHTFFKLKEEDIEQVRQFQSLKRVLQILQRQIDNLIDVNRDFLRTTSPKRMSVTAGVGSSASVSLNVSRRATSIEHVVHDKSNAVLDAVLQFSSVVEKLQDAPPFYEAFLPEETIAVHRGSGVENLLPPELQNRLLYTHPS